MSAESPRADYAPTRLPDAGGAVVSFVAPESPADDAGILSGMRVLSVNGVPLTDMIVWMWESDGDEIELEVLDPSDGSVATAELTRFLGEQWGLEFDGAVFDGMRTCVNACLFCFMRMLPKGHRASLSIRDDDYRLSFLQGNFVTLTNMSDEDVRDAVDRMLSPLNVSLHAVTPEVRRRLMGRNAQRGMEVLERLLASGIEVHAQVVLCPGINDGDELERTLAFCEERPLISSLAIVPLGFTKHQDRFTTSYSDDPELARSVIETLAPYQRRARARCGRTVFQAADEFYLAADVEVPPAEEYDGYPQFYDGIGMIRSFIDDTDALLRDDRDRLEKIADLTRCVSRRIRVLSGEAARATVARLIEADPLRGVVTAIRNDYFGGNVDVTGLICAEDVLAQLPSDLRGDMLFVPSLIFNADGLTLDGYHRDELVSDLIGRGAAVVVCDTTPFGFVEAAERAFR